MIKYWQVKRRKNINLLQTFEIVKCECEYVRSSDIISAQTMKKSFYSEEEAVKQCGKLNQRFEVTEFKFFVRENTKTSSQKEEFYKGK